jgi:hypothetical protein
VTVRMQPTGAYLHDQVHVVVDWALFRCSDWSCMAQQAVQGNPGLIGTPRRVVPGNQGLIGIPPVQSISPERSPCSAGSQSVRLCNDDFQPCNSACTAAIVSDASAGITGCTQGCCTKFSACLSIRGCSNLTSLNCFSGTSPSVRALRGGGIQ